MAGPVGRRVTAAMVARRAGTSVSTVSLVVNGKSRGRVSAVITERVRAAVDELGYVVDHAASSLARGTTDLVVLLAPDLPNPYFGRVTTGIREALGSRHQLMLSVIEGGEQPGADDVRRVAAFRPAGLLVHAPSPTFLDDLEPGGPPLVLMDAPGFEGRAATVTFDLEPGVRALVAHLAEAGHTVLAYLEGSTPSATFTVRRELLARVAAEHGLRVLDDGTRAGLTLDAAADVGTEALPRWRAAGATAVVAAADTMAYGVLAAAHRLGLAVPGDIAVAGFDDLPYSQVTAPSLTSVALPAEELGRAAAQRLAAVLAGDGDGAAAPLLPSRLAARASTGA
jgi:LacI family transcriptional regulator